MPIIKSAEKRVRTTKTKTARNRALKSQLRTAIKNFKTIAEEGDKVKAAQTLQTTQKIIDKIAAKGVIHKNNAARKKSQLTNIYNQMS